MALHERANLVASDDPDSRVRALIANSDPFALQPDAGTLEDAHRRLAIAADESRSELRRLRERLEQRDVTTGDPGVQALAPASGGMPGYLASEFVASAAARASLFAALRVEPLPDGAQVVDHPYFSSSASVSSPSEGSGVSEPAANVPDVDLVSSPIETISGMVEFSIQASEWMLPGSDAVMARELGRKLGERLDAQLIAGTGTKPQLRGAVNVSGILSISYTGSTVAAPISKLWDAYRQLSDPAIGYGDSESNSYLVVLHPRRWAYLNGGGQNSQAIPPNIPGRPVPSGGVRSALGAGTNEDEALVLLAETNHVRASAPVVRPIADYDGSGNLQVRFIAHQFVASAYGPPRSIARLSGTGFTPPSL